MSEEYIEYENIENVYISNDVGKDVWYGECNCGRCDCKNLIVTEHGNYNFICEVCFESYGYICPSCLGKCHTCTF